MGHLVFWIIALLFQSSVNEPSLGLISQLNQLLRFCIGRGERKEEEETL